MLKRHEDALMQRFDAVTNLGYSFIELWELYLWYGRDRIGKAVWRDLRDRFDETAAASDELWIYSADTGVMLIHSDGLQKISEKMSASE